MTLTDMRGLSHLLVLLDSGEWQMPQSDTNSSSVSFFEYTVRIRCIVAITTRVLLAYLITFLATRGAISCFCAAVMLSRYVSYCLWLTTHSCLSVGTWAVKAVQDPTWVRFTLHTPESTGAICLLLKRAGVHHCFGSWVAV